MLDTFSWRSPFTSPGVRLAEWLHKRVWHLRAWGGARIREWSSYMPCGPSGTCHRVKRGLHCTVERRGDGLHPLFLHGGIPYLRCEVLGPASPPLLLSWTVTFQHFTRRPGLLTPGESHGPPLWAGQSPDASSQPPLEPSRSYGLGWHFQEQTHLPGDSSGVQSLSEKAA